VRLDVLTAAKQRLQVSIALANAGAVSALLASLQYFPGDRALAELALHDICQVWRW
jgi:hypothetical protein